MSTHFHRLEVIDVRRETPDCLSVSFRVPPHLKELFCFTQGQNITIRAIIGNEELRRSYSVCSSPLEDELRVAIKVVKGGKFSAWANEHIQQGEVLEVLPPTGRFYTRLDAGNRKNYMAFAAGSGITPIISIIKTTLALEKESRFTLVYGNRNRASIIFREELEAIKNTYMSRFSLHHILSREKTDIPLYQGRIDEQKCESIFRFLEDPGNIDEWFLCGPQEMIFLLRDHLLKKGISPENIHFELFTVPGQHQAGDSSMHSIAAGYPAGKTAAVTIKSDGIAFEFKLAYEGASILNAALAAGADLPFSCKGGVCATCRALLAEGQVSMDNNYALEPEELKKGFILTCQSHPRSEKIVIDFDFRG